MNCCIKNYYKEISNSLSLQLSLVLTLTYYGPPIMRRFDKYSKTDPNFYSSLYNVIICYITKGVNRRWFLITNAKPIHHSSPYQKPDDTLLRFYRLIEGIFFVSPRNQNDNSSFYRTVIFTVFLLNLGGVYLLAIIILWMSLMTWRLMMARCFFSIKFQIGIHYHFAVWIDKGGYCKWKCDWRFCFFLRNFKDLELLVTPN